MLKAAQTAANVVKLNTDILLLEYAPYSFCEMTVPADVKPHAVSSNKDFQSKGAFFVDFGKNKKVAKTNAPVHSH